MLVGLVAGLIGCRASVHRDRLPVRSANLCVGSSNFSLLFSEFRAFAADNRAKIDISRVSPSEPRYRIQLWSEEVEIIAVNPFEIEVFRVGVYNPRQKSLSPARALHYLEALRSRTEAVPGAAFDIEP